MMQKPGLYLHFEKKNQEDHQRMKHTIAKLDKILYMEETEAWQRSTENGSLESDRNTTHSHAVTNQRRRENKTVCNGTETDDTKDMHNITVDIYKGHLGKWILIKINVRKSD
jgi:hypothetical protein